MDHLPEKRRRQLARFASCTTTYLGGRTLVAVVAFGLGVSMLAGCSKAPSPGAEPNQSQAATAKPDAAAKATAENTVFAPLQKDLERARQVQDTVNKQAKQLSDQIDKATGAASDEENGSGR